jgi:hypothetical protein
MDGEQPSGQRIEEGQREHGEHAKERGDRARCHERVIPAGAPSLRQ